MPHRLLRSPDRSTFTKLHVPATSNSQVYSQYKSRPTLKCLVGITQLSGKFSFISQPAAGNTSNKKIVKKPNIIDKFEPHDICKDFYIQESLLNNQVHLLSAAISTYNKKQKSVKLSLKWLIVSMTIGLCHRGSIGQICLNITFKSVRHGGWQARPTQRNFVCRSWQLTSWDKLSQKCVWQEVGKYLPNIVRGLLYYSWLWCKI